MATTIHRAGAPIAWEGSRDNEWYREYSITTLVASDDPLDGPNEVMNTSGLLLPGATYAFGNDNDSFAYVYPEMKIGVHAPKDGDPPRLWAVTQKASSKPLKRCSETQVDDPLLQPDKVSGSFLKEKEEAVYDRFGYGIMTSSHELIRGPQVEFDVSRPKVKIEQNVADLELGTLVDMIDTVNDDTLWGCARRCVKLSDITWDIKWYGTCNKYYTRVLDFEINRRTFDRRLLDEGTKVLHGRWATAAELALGTGTGSDFQDGNPNGWVLIKIAGEYPDSNNPAHFDRYKDRNGENARVILDGFGQPWTGIQLGTGTDAIDNGPGSRYVEKYGESNFLLLGIPTEF